jgi:hypothetical protein
LCIGGSSTHGVFNDRRHTYPFLLGEQLNAIVSSKSEIRFDVFNLGLSGSSDDEFIDHPPDVVIFYTGYNDIFTRDVTYATERAKLGQVWGVITAHSAWR